MSTKTLRKRVALVAVSAMGFGLMSVVPANAGAAAATDLGLFIGSATGTTTVLTVPVGSEARTSLFGDLDTAALPATDDIVVTPTVTGPSNSGAAAGVPAYGVFGIVTTGAADPFVTTAAANKATLSVAAGALTITGGTGDVALTTAAVKIGEFAFTPDKAGLYVVTLSVNDKTDNSRTLYVNATTAAVNPSGTASLAASWNAGAYRVGVGAPDDTDISNSYLDPTVTVTALTGSAIATTLPIRAMVTQSPDSDLPVGTVLGGTNNSQAAPNVVTNIATLDNDQANNATLLLETGDATNDLIQTAGTYSFLFFEDGNADGIYTSGERWVTTSVVLGGAPTAYAFARNPSSIVQPGTVVTVDTTFTDALGRATVLNATDTVTLTAGTSITLSSATIQDGQAVTTSGKYNGVYRITATVATTATSGAKSTSAEGSVGTGLTLVAGSFSITVGAAESATSLAYVAETTNAVAAATQVELTPAGTATGAITVDVADTSVFFNATSTTASEYIRVTITPTGSKLNTTRMSASGVQLYRALADKSSAFGVTITAPVAGDSYTVTLEAGATDLVYTVTYAAITPSWTILPGTSLTQKIGSTSSFVAILQDQWSRPQASKAVTFTVTGRNATTASLTTDAAGRVSFDVKDTYVGTDLTSDAITLSYVYLDSTATATVAAGNTAAIAYTATGIVVGSIAMTSSTVADRTIDQAERVAGSPDSTAIVTYTAVVKLATGATAGAGVVVNFTGGADDKFVLGLATGVTGSTGTATVQVYRQKTGYANISATANAITGVAVPVKWVNTTAAARTVSVSVEPTSIVSEATATVKAIVTDRWGNPVYNVPVTFSEVGAGRLSTSAAVNTNASGIAQVDFTSAKNEVGTNEITAEISGGQSADLAGFVTTGGVVTPVTGVTAGVSEASTKVTVTKDTSTSTADALLALATALGTRDQASAAVDAAAEATDAANAATDAANAAAEAADAATAAAQDAADAVAALSTQVSEMVAALKKQITSLTNLVIKIQKKVRA
jgi:trimeric autotransporter adhesin